MHIVKKFKVENDTTEANIQSAIINTFFDTFAKFEANGFTEQDLFKATPKISFIFPAIRSVHAHFDMTIKQNKAKICVTSENRANSMFWIMLFTSIIFPAFGLIFLAYYFKANDICDKALLHAMEQVQAELEDA